VKEGFRSLHARLFEISKSDHASEEQVRVWCIDALRATLGYDDSEINTEMKVLGNRVDIVLSKADRVFLVIECKNIRSALKTNVRDQAAQYATSLSADWALVTNGQVWKLYRVIPQPGKDPTIIEVFDVALLDEEGVSDRDAEMLYLLTSRGILSGDSERMYHQVAATSERRILKALKSDRVASAMRKELAESYKQETSQHVVLDDDYVSEVMEDAFEPLEW